MKIETEIFRTQGFLTINNFLSTNELDRFNRELLILQDSIEQKDAPHYGKRDTAGRIVYLNRLDVASDFFFDIARDKRFINIAETLLGKAVVPLHVECFIKPSHSHDVTPAHQDHIFYSHFPDETAIAIWLALDEVTEQSSPLEYIPCSLGVNVLLPHSNSDAQNLDHELMPKIAATLNSYICAPVTMGGCVIHHSFVIHRASPNMTNNDRRAIVFNYRGSPWREEIRSINLVAE